ncbi:hypothetical protein PRIPAC_78539 [Pristionchus pacificus]|uniref:G protein-coupled receptor n=1 Tax=Pristionchus pacificus TaxID=54126 RepID=A0A2A6BY09_PRIPA|nr:hypothetical protein PRIPAC_78539 [Pristionchus pacificus]|eukprot:PDM70892.1 G protein-coupled receptor [Pristionchus pacificus]
MAASSGFLTIFFPPPVFYAEMNDCKNQSYCEIHQWFSFLTPVNRTGMVDIGRRQSLSIVTTTVESFVDYYFFPIQFVLGVIGNSINLVVLLSRSMRTEANLLLAAMAFADICLFFTRILFCVSVYEPVYRNNTFRAIFFTIRQNVNAVCNFFSAATCWFVLAVSLERYMGIRNPMHPRMVFGNGRIHIIIGMIFVGSFLVTAFHHFEYETGFYWNKNHTIVYPIFNHVLSMTNPNTTMLEDISPQLKTKATFVDIGKLVSLVTVIIVPQLLICFFNISIIAILRKRNNAVCRFDNQGRDTRDFARWKRHERKATVTVVAIVTCYSVTVIPSAIPFVIELYHKLFNKVDIVQEKLKEYLWLYFIVVPLLSTLTLTGKTCNFLLFCLSSAHFRRRLRQIVLNKCRMNKANQKNSTEERSTRVIFDLQSRTSRFSSVLLSSQPNGLYRPATRVSSLGDRESVHRNLSTATQFDALELDLISPMLNNN